MTVLDYVVQGTIVTPNGLIPRGWVGIKDATIAVMGQGEVPASADTFDAGDAYLIPGVVDGQTHATSYGGLPGIESTTRSAIAGGITTLVDMPYDNPAPLSTIERFDAKVQAIRRYAYCDMALYGTITKGQSTADARQLVKRGICAFKISSFESNAVRFPRISTAQTQALLELAAEVDLPVGLHNEDQEIVLATIERFRQEGKTTAEWHAASRPEIAELAATAQFLEMGAATGAHVHLVHLSTKRGYDLVRQYREQGFAATAELCVHYLHFDAGVDVPRLGALLKVNPPIRHGQRELLWEAYAQGKVAFISSDHSSWPVDGKHTETIFEAGAGIPGLETMVASLYTDLAARFDNPVERLVENLCSAPARFFGLERKGAIAIGKDADLAVLQPAAVTFSAAASHDDLNWSPYDGERFAARIAATFLRGRLVWDGTNIVGQPGEGTFVPRTGPGSRSLFKALAN